MLLNKRSVSPIAFWTVVALLTTFDAARQSVAADPPASRHAEADARLSQENYEKITNGMTGDEVRAILGKPPAGAGTKGDWTSSWRLSTDKAQTIHVHYKDGVVDRKSNSMHWGQPAETADAPSKSSDRRKPSKSDTKTDSSPEDKLTSLLRELHNRDGGKRKAAIRAINGMTPDAEHASDVVSALVPLLRDQDQGFQMEVHDVLRKWATKDTDEPFLKLLEKKPKTTSPLDSDRDRLTFAMEIVSKVKDPQAVEPLCKILHWSFFDRNEAADTLKKFGPELAQKEVLKYANDPDPGVQQKVKEILEAFKTSASDLVGQLLADLKADKPETRFHAANKLAQMPVDAGRRREVAAQLATMLGDRLSSVNQDLKTSQHGKPKGSSLGALLGEMTQHPANAAMAALIVWGGPENEEAVLAVVKDKNAIEDMKVGALRALAAWGTAKSLPTLQPLAKNQGAAFSSMAQNAVKAISERKGK